MPAPPATKPNPTLAAILQTARSLADHRDNHRACVIMPPVLPEVNSLPRAEQQLPIGKRHGFARACERHLDVARHVVRTFKRVGKMRIIFRNQSLEPGFEIGAGRRIGIFHNDQAATRVLAKRRHRATFQFASGQFASDERRDLVQALASRVERMRRLVDGHMK